MSSAMTLADILKHQKPLMDLLPKLKKTEILELTGADDLYAGFYIIEAAFAKQLQDEWDEDMCCGHLVALDYRYFTKEDDGIDRLYFKLFLGGYLEDKDFLDDDEKPLSQTCGEVAELKGLLKSLTWAGVAEQWDKIEDLLCKVTAAGRKMLDDAPDGNDVEIE